MPLVLYEELEVTVPDTAGDQLLILHARVVHQRAVDATAGEKVYGSASSSRPLRTETRRCLDGLSRTVHGVARRRRRAQGRLAATRYPVTSVALTAHSGHVAEPSTGFPRPRGSRPRSSA